MARTGVRKCNFGTSRRRVGAETELEARHRGEYHRVELRTLQNALSGELLGTIALTKGRKVSTSGSTPAALAQLELRSSYLHRYANGCHVVPAALEETPVERCPH